MQINTGKTPPVWNQTEAMYSALVFLSSFSLNMFSSTLVSYCETFLNMDTPTFSALVMMWTLESAICLGIVQPALVREVGEIATLQLSFLCMIVFYVLFCLLTPENSAWASCLSFGSCNVTNHVYIRQHQAQRGRTDMNWTCFTRACCCFPVNGTQVFVIMILFSMGSITYPLAVSLATRELPPELQGSLQGAATWSCRIRLQWKDFSWNSMPEIIKTLYFHWRPRLSESSSSELDLWTLKIDQRTWHKMRWMNQAHIYRCQHGWALLCF